MYKHLKGEPKEDMTRLFSVVPRNRTRSNGHKFKYRKFCSNTEKKKYYEGGKAVEQVAKIFC